MRKPPVILNKSHIDSIFQVIFPPRCAGCGLWGESLFCKKCEPELQPLTAPLCAICGLPFDRLAKVTAGALCADCHDNRYHSAPPLAALRAPLVHSGAIRNAVHQLKYNGKTARAPQLAKLLHTYLTATEEGRNLPLEKIRFLIPVPLHSYRAWRRGHNQSELLARELADLLRDSTRPPVMKEALRRVRHTLPQADLHADERGANIRGAFSMEPSWQCHTPWPADDAVLLLDDVSTTGATLFECARVLHKDGGIPTTNIYALTLARAI